MRIVHRKGALLRTAGVVGLILLLLAGLWSCNRKEPRESRTGPQDTDPQPKDSLRILYAGRPSSDREKDFVSFLKQHFEVVQTADLRRLKESDTQGFDVTLLDWDNNVLEGPRPELSEGFSRPVITLGVAGGGICQQWRLKTGYL